MRVMHLLTSSSFSGAENVVCQIIGTLKEDSTINCVYCSPEGPIRQALAERNIDYLPIAAMTRKDVLYAINQYSPDIIHAHGTTAAVKAALICGDIPLVFHIHNNSFDSRRLSMKSIANLIPFVKSRHVIWVSQHCQECYMFSGITRHKSSVVSNGIDLDVFRANKKKTDVNKLIMVSRFAPAKDQETVIKAMTLVDQRFQLFLVGDGEKRSECETLAKELNVENRVHFLGMRSDIPQLIGDAFVGIQSSHWEGFGMSAVEIMACGIPVIASDADGLKQVVEGAGVIFKTGNEIELANAIESLSSDKTYYEKKSRACLERAKEYSIEKTAKRCFDIYKDICGR